MTASTPASTPASRCQHHWQTVTLPADGWVPEPYTQTSCARCGAVQ